MTNTAIDQAILHCVKPSWRKVALIIIQTADRLGEDFRSKKTSYNLIAERIKLMVQAGRLLSQGNLERWRYSEIKSLTHQEAEQGAAANP